MALPALVICAQTFFTAAITMVVRHFQNKRASSSNMRRGGNPRHVGLGLWLSCGTQGCPCLEPVIAAG